MISCDISCEWAVERLLEYVEGDMAVEHRSAMEGHLVGCASCAERARLLSAEVKLLRAYYRKTRQCADR